MLAQAKIIIIIERKRETTKKKQPDFQLAYNLSYTREA